jgi:crotonobetainyl-CoA:carnitine CoA-transferase CaiB-like acyl-CoA transferase
MATVDEPEPRGPLAGLVVADCSTILAGPLCTMLLADLGADVVKVEPPDGDATRTWGPPWVGSDEEGTRTAAYFLAVNRNKRSVRVDLRAEGGKDILRRLLGRADVVVENFRVGGFARLGFDEAELRRINPRLVHLAISGYGTHGPDAERPGYDAVVQATGGLMSITGAPERDGGEPTKVGVAISDVVSGLFGTITVLAALVERAAAGSAAPGGAGPGQRIDVSLLASTLAVLVNQAQNAFVTGEAPGRRGNAHPNIVPYEAFETSDGRLVVAVGSERQWQRFCEALGVAELAADPRFASNGQRVVNRDALRPLLAERLRSRTRAEWQATLEAAEVPCGPILDVAEAFAAPQAQALAMDVQVDHPVLGALHQVGFPFAFERTPPSIRSAPPLLGEHSDEVLGELGYGTGAIRALRADGVI